MRLRSDEIKTIERMAGKPNKPGWFSVQDRIKCLQNNSSSDEDLAVVKQLEEIYYNEIRKIARNPNDFGLSCIYQAMKCLEENSSSDESDRDMLKRLKEIYYDIPPGIIIGTFSNNSGGKPSFPSDFPLYHRGEWRKYKTSANGWAYGGEICVLLSEALLPKGKNHFSFPVPNKSNYVQMFPGDEYILPDNRKFRVWGVAGNPLSFDKGGVRWVDR